MHAAAIGPPVDAEPELARSAGDRPAARREPDGGDPWAAALRSAFDNAPIGMVVAQTDGTVVAGNAALGRLLGAEPDVLVGSALFGRVHPDDRARAVAACATLMQSLDGHAELDCRFVRPDGSVPHVKVTSSRVGERATASGSVPAHVVMHLEDVTGRYEREDGLRLAALHDPLTGLPNRVLLAEHLQRELDVRRTSDEHVLVFFVDLDRFKDVNDRYGHAAGDAVLVEVAQRIRSCLRPGDVAARVGGDEFVVLCPGLAAGSAPDLAGRLQGAVALPVEHVAASLIVTASVGWAASRGGDRVEVLLHDADTAMYAAKGERLRLRPSSAVRRDEASS